MNISVLDLAFVCLAAALGLTVFRLFRGPTLPDRIVALELSSMLVIGFILLLALETSEPLYVDVAVAMALVAFLGSVALARYVDGLARR